MAAANPAATRATNGDGTNTMRWSGGGTKPAASYNPRTARRMMTRSSSVIGAVESALAIHRSVHGWSCARCASVRVYFCVRAIP